MSYINLQKRYNLVRWTIYIPCSYPYILKIQQSASASVIGLRPNFTIADCSASADCENCSFGHCLAVSYQKKKMWKLFLQKRISTHCVIVKSPGSQVYLNFLFNGHFFTDAQMHFRELSVKLCQLKSLFRTTSYKEYFFTFLQLESLQILSQREIIWGNSSMRFSTLIQLHTYLSIEIFHLSF